MAIELRDLDETRELFGLINRMVNELGYSEFEDCSGTGLGFCRASFVNADGTQLFIVTVNNDREPYLYRWWIEESK